VIFGGQLVVPAEAAKAPFWVWNQGLRQLYVSSIHVAPWSVLEIARAIDKSGAIYVLGYPSALFEFAKIALENAIATPKMKVVISNAEPLFDFQRQVIQEAFGAPVVDTYGLAEMVAAAGECEVGGLHLWPDAGVVEILADDEDKPLADGQVGRLIGTGLVNDDMPLIRYEVGDRGSLKPARFFCDCGRKLPVLGEVQGRLDDLVVTPDGRRVGRLDHAFKKDLPIRAAQVMQESLHSIKVLVEPAAGFDQRAREEIARSLRDRLGDMNIEVEEVSLIPRGASGKLRGVVSRITTGS
jgi:phenylacetate-CoA ligase